MSRSYTSSSYESIEPRHLELHLSPWTLAHNWCKSTTSGLNEFGTVGKSGMVVFRLDKPQVAPSLFNRAVPSYVSRVLGRRGSPGYLESLLVFTISTDARVQISCRSSGPLAHEVNFSLTITRHFSATPKGPGRRISHRTPLH